MLHTDDGKYTHRSPGTHIAGMMDGQKLKSARNFFSRYHKLVLFNGSSAQCMCMKMDYVYLFFYSCFLFE